MNKLFTKIASLTLGLALVAGAGAFVANSQVKSADASSVEKQIYSEDFTDWNVDQGYGTETETQKPTDAPSVTNTWMTSYAGIAATGINGNTMKVRAYKKSGHHDGYFYSNFSLEKVTKVKFDFKSGRKELNQGYEAFYKTTSEGSWISFGSGTPTNTNVQNCEHTISATGEYATVWLKVVMTSDVNTNTGSNYDMSFDNLVVYGMVEQSGSITGVDVYGPGAQAGEVTVSSGYLGRAKVQLSATVSQSGSGLSEDVTWSSSNDNIAAVDADGLVTIKANDTATITATSVADPTVSGTIDVVGSGLLTFTGSTTSTNFDTTDLGSEQILSETSGELADLSGALVNANVYADKSTSSNKPGFYTSNPISVRMYTDTKLTVSMPNNYKLYWVDFTCVADYEMTTTKAAPSVGALTNKGLISTIDFTSTTTSSVTITFVLQVRLTAVSVSYGPKVLSSVRIDNASTSNQFMQNSVITVSDIQSAGISAAAVYEDSSELDVTTTATWTLDTSTVGTAELVATYGGVASAGVLVTIIDTAVPATGITVSPSSSTLYVGRKVTLVPAISPNNATDKTVSWESNDTSVAEVNENGQVTAKAVGTATITATANGGVDVTAEIAITVKAFEYAKATSINGGDKVLITNSAETRFMGEINTYAAATEYSDYPETECVYSVVAGSKDGSFAFKNSDGKYLSWVADNTLNLFEPTPESPLGENQSWTVLFDGTAATIKNVADESENGRIIKFNTDRFATYSNKNATNTVIWKLDGAAGEVEANAFASSVDGFMKDIGEDVCDEQGVLTDLSLLASAWETYEGKYELLSDEAKSFIAASSADPDGTDVEAMLSLYNYIYEKYGTSLELNNWLGRSEAAKGLASPVIINNNIDSANNGISIIVVTVIALVSISSIAVLLVIKRRKTY